MTTMRTIDRDASDGGAPDAANRVRDYYTLVDRGDVEGLLRLFADDAVYHRPGYEPITGRGQLRRFYLEERVIDCGEHTVRDVVAHEDAVAVQGEFAGVLKSGETTRLRFADFFTVGGDGLFTRRDTFFFVPLV